MPACSGAVARAASKTRAAPRIKAGPKTRAAARARAALAVTAAPSNAGAETTFDAGDADAGAAGGQGGARPDAGNPIDFLLPAGPAQCSGYCETALDTCEGTLAVYRSIESCLGVCANLPAGNPDAPEPGNTIACREENARFARSTSEPEIHCPAAGPGGNDTGSPAVPACGTDCEAYCTLREGICTGVGEEVILPHDECLRQCSGLVDDETFDVEAAYGDHHDSLQCRLAHVSAAAVGSGAAPVHCPHTRITVDLTTPCAEPSDTPGNCEAYCKMVMVSCTGDQAVYETEDQCLDTCAALAPGVYPDRGGQDTVGCRRYHSHAALSAPATHCSHAGPMGDGICSSENCTPHCRILKAACPDQFNATHTPDDIDDPEDLGTCPETCMDLEGADAGSDYAVSPVPTGDTVQCRMLNAARAFEDEAFCPAAFGGGDCQ
jgi:hypothetical protein